MQCQLKKFTALSADPLLIWNYGTMAVLSFLSDLRFGTLSVALITVRMS